MISTATLLVSCPDRKGLVARISDFIFRHGGNILHADQHTDLEKVVLARAVRLHLKRRILTYGNKTVIFD